MRGKKVVLYFYPKDLTSGYTKEPIDFSKHCADFSAANTKIVGISADSVASHEKFIAKHGLNLRLAADEEKKTIVDYGVWVEKNMYGRKYGEKSELQVMLKKCWKRPDNLNDSWCNGPIVSRLLTLTM